MGEDETTAWRRSRCRWWDRCQLASCRWVAVTLLIAAAVGRVAGQLSTSFDEQERENLFFIAQGWRNGEELLDKETSAALESWDLSANPCTYRGVSCNVNGSVTEINLAGLRILGTVSPVFGEFAHLQTLILSDNVFFGTLPDTLAELNALLRLDVSNNTLYGPMPDFLASLPNLTLPTALNLANNQFEAPIPTNLSSKFCYPQFAGNPAVEGLDAATINATFPPCSEVFVPPTPSGSGPNTGAVVGGAVGGAALLAVLCAAAFLYWLRNHDEDAKFTKLSKEDLEDIEAGFSGTSLARIRRFGFLELVDATDNFSEANKLGEGGYATVFKATVDDGRPLAVKRLKTHRIGKGEMLEFLNEIDTISRAVHRNVLRLEGYCIENGERIMVFPFMANGSARDHLQGRDAGVPPLSLELRRQIAIGAAQGLTYLHDDCESRIIHRDIKAANVLLGDKYNAVVADFGLAKLVDYEETHVTTAVRGTFGYIAPEYFMTGQTSDKSDVYSFGVFLLEMVTGKDAPTLSQDPGARSGLRTWFSSSFQEGRLTQMIDIELRLIDIEVEEGEYKTEVLEDIVQVGLLCLAEDPKMRPSMADVVRLLQGDGLEQAWRMWEQQQGDVTEDEHNWDMPGYGYNSATSLSSGTQGGTDISMVGYNLSGPR